MKNKVLVNLSNYFLQKNLKISEIRELRRRKNYWRKRGIPGPKPALFTGNLQAIWGPDYPPVLRYRDWTRHYGRFYGVQLGGVSMLVISDPEMAQNLLSRDFSVFHERKVCFSIITLNLKIFMV